MSNINIHNSDVLEWLKNYTGPKFHSVISDPPYGLAFMGKTWDKFTPIQYQTWVTEWSKELIKHLYPGAVCMFFGGTRTYHRLATGLEDAGFEIFDSMMWCYGSGFPKSYNISKGIDSKFGLEREVVGYKKDISHLERGDNNYLEQNRNYSDSSFTENKSKQLLDKPNHPLAHQYNGYGTALKPAFEPIVLCRKPRGKETFVDCALNYGSGSLNVDGTRIQTKGELITGPLDYINEHEGYQRNWKQNKELVRERKQLAYDKANSLGRFPANLGLICDCECEPCECIEKELDNQSGITGNGYRKNNSVKVNQHQNNTYGKYQDTFEVGERGHNDNGGASRFFYTAKSSRKERNLGLDHLPETETQVAGWSGDGMPLRQNGTERKMPVAQNNHPTVKPIKLIEYLATMLKPPVEDSSILIPFSGSGSEIIGAMFAGWNIINALEIDENYCNIAENRISYWKQFSTYDKGLKD